MKESEPIVRSVQRPQRNVVAVPPAPPLAAWPSGAVDRRHGVSLADVCWRRRGTVAAGVLACLIAAAVYVATATRTYTPTASLYVDANGMRLLGKDKETSTADAESYLFRQCELIRSERVVRQAVDACRLDVARMYPGSLDRVGDVRNALTVTVGKKDDVITVALTSALPAEGARLVNAIVAAYQASEREQAHETASDAVSILQADKKREEEALDRQQRQIVAFKQANGEMFFSTDRGTNITIQNLATISDTVTKVRVYAAQARALYALDPSQLRRQACEQADAEQRQLEQLYEQQKADALKINAASAEFQKLQADADRTIKQCDLLDVRIRELDVTQQGGPDIRVLEAAKTEPKPTSPRKSVAALSALGGGLALGCALALLRDATDQRLRTAPVAGRMLGLPVLGVLPEASDGRAGGDPLRWARAVRQAPDGDLAEAFRSLASEVCFGAAFRSGRSLLVTSPSRGDGKSTVAANLAAAAAGAGRRTLLIDADLRHPVQHQVFDVVGTIGLADVVLDGFGIDQAVRPTAVRGLSLLSAGTSAGNPVQVIGSAGFGDLLRQLEEQFELVVIDAPPLLGVGDARVLAAHADAAVLVVRAKRTTRAAARLACDRVLGVGCNLLGLAFNGSGHAEAEAESDAHAGTTAAGVGRSRTGGYAADRPAWDGGSTWSPARAAVAAGLPSASALVAGVGRADARLDRANGGGRKDS